MTNINEKLKASQWNLSPVKIVGYYLFFGSLWILFSDKLVEIIFISPSTYTLLQTLKGWFFVFVSGVMIFLLINRSITRIKLSERSQYITNRALKVLSDCNQVLIRATEENELVEDICQIIVESGGYRLVWIGYAEQDQEKTVRPVAHRGFEDGYLDTVKITWADTERSRGPTGTAIRTAKHVISNNITVDPQFSPWRADALKRGYASSIALPLIAEKQVLGAINIYATRPDAFDVEECKLLIELTNDISYGITTLRTRMEHTKAVEALRESEDHFKQFFENNLEYCYMISPEGIILDINSAALKALGYRKKELVGKPLNIIYTSDSQAKVKKLFEKWNPKGSFKNEEMIIVTKSGEKRTILLSVDAVRDDNGKILHSVSIQRDINELKDVEKELQKKEELYRKLFENISSGVAIYKAVDDGNDFIIMDFNKAAETMENIKKENVIGRKVTEVFPGIKEFGLFQVFKKVWHSGKPEFFPVSLYQDGRISGWRENYVYKIATGEVVAVYNDVTELKKAEKELLINQSLLNHTQQLTKVGGWEYDVLTARLTWTDEVYRIHGVLKDTYDPNNIDEDIRFYSPENQKIIEKAFRAAIERGEPYDLELQFNSADGKRLWVRTVGHVEKKNGKVFRVFGNIMDITEKKNVEIALQESGELLRETGRIAQIGGWEFDPLTMEGTWTDEVARIHDLDPEQDTNVEMGLSYYSGENRKKIEHAVKEAIELGKPYDLELEMITAKGAHKWVRTIGNPIKDGNKVVKVRGSIQDITERKKADDVLSETNLFLNSIIDQSPHPMWISDEKGTLIRLNQACCDLLGITDDEVVGIYNIFKDNIVEEQGQMPAVKSVFEEGLTACFRLQYDSSHLKNLRLGKTAYVILEVTIFPIKDLEGNITNAVIQHLDVTEKIMAEEESVKLAKFPSENPNPVLRIAEDGTVIYANNPAINLLDSWGIALNQRLPDTWRKISSDVLRSNVKKEIELESNGFIYLLVFTPIKVSHVVNIYGYDITARKRAEEEVALYRIHLEKIVKSRTKKLEERTEELKKANIHLQEADRLKSVFLASMSHELRTPLNSIIGFTGILLMGMTGELSEEQKKQLTMVKTSSQHLLSLINDILDISKIEAGKVELSCDEFELDDVVHEIVEAFSGEVSDKNLELFIDMPEGIVLFSDRRRIKQVLMNLMSNAVKFTERGNVSITARILKKDTLEIRVKDTGAGMKKRDMHKLFQPFQQIDMSLTKKHEGTGLGLYLVKNLVTLFGGDISVKSENGKGSEFVFTIPLTFKKGTKK